MILHLSCFLHLFINCVLIRFIIKTVLQNFVFVHNAIRLPFPINPTISCVNSILFYTPRKLAGLYSDPYVRPFVRSFVHSSVRPSPSLIRYYSKTAEQNSMKLSGIVHYMMPYCTSYFKFLFEWFWGFPEQNKDFAIQNMGERGVSFCEHCSQYF